jgi:aminomethyltransferase
VNAPLLRTPLYPEHRALEGRLVPFAGYEMPVQYRGISVEHQAVRQSAGLFDVSHMGELEVNGPGALAFVNGLITNDLARAKDGQAVYTCCCNEAGTILDDLIVYRRSPTEILVVCNASNREKIASHFAARATNDVSFRDASDDYALLALQGPRALEVLAAAGSSIDVGASVPRFRFTDAEVAGKKAIIARTGYTGEDGVELFLAPSDAVSVWRALLEAGKSVGIEPVGLGARDTLRLEARLALYGNDIDETTNPLEAGLGWTVKLDKPDFLGKAALVAVQQAGLSRTLVGFEMVGRGIARHGYPLLDTAGAVAGVCTSGGPSPTLGKSIGLGYLPLAFRTPGSRFLVDCRGKSIEAVVVPTPFYQRDKR